MFCRNCGAKLEDGANFCWNCGSQVAATETAANTAADRATNTATDRAAAADTAKAAETVGAAKAAKPRRGNAPKNMNDKTRLYVCIAIAAVIVAAIVVCCVLFLGGSSGEYKDKMAQADQFMTNMDYDNAVMAYNEAITIAPKKPDAYRKLVEIYTIERDFDSASEVLAKAEKAGCGDKLKEETENVTSGRAFDDFISSDEYWDDKVMTDDYSDYIDGHVCSYIGDVDGSGTLDLITVSASYDDEYIGDKALSTWYARGLVLTVTFYIYNPDVDDLETYEMDIDCGGFADASSGAFRFDLFMKKQETGSVLAIAMHGASIDDGIDEMIVLPFRQGQINKVEKTTITTGACLYYWQDDELLIEYNAYDYLEEEDLSKQKRDESISKSIEAFHKRHDHYGLGDKLVDYGYSEGWSSVKIVGCNEEDPTETHLAVICLGAATPDGDEWEFNPSGEEDYRFYVEDYSEDYYE